MSRPWSGREIANLKKLYPTYCREALMEAFAPRTWNAIKAMAKTIGLVRPIELGGRRKWDQIAASHKPVFQLPTDVEIEISYRRPWS